MAVKKGLEGREKADSKGAACQEADNKRKAAAAAARKKKKK